MEFTNEIFFNKPLIAGNTVIITYKGQLYREHSKDVTIVYGYGENWNETDNAVMKETDNGFEVTLTIKDYDTFNFCFNNSFNIWDNNFGFNYIAPISHEQTAQPSTEIIEKEEKDEEINNIENTEPASNIDEISEASVSENIYSSNSDIVNNSEASSSVEDTNIKENNNDDSNPPSLDRLNEEASSATSTSSNENIEADEEAEVENDASATEESNASTSNFENTNQNEDIEAIFSSLLDSILDSEKAKNETIDIENLSGFGLQSVDEIKEEDMINCDNIFSELFEELTADTTSSQTTDSQASISTNYDDYDTQELDNLMDNLLMSITDTNNTDSYATPIAKIETAPTSSQQQDLSNENVGLLAPIESEDWVDKIINISYTVTKKITTACKKFGSLLKLKAKELGIINND